MASQYPRNIITAKGYNLLAESIATKKAVVFTKVVVGNGDDSGKNISQMTNVISPKMTLPVSSAIKDGDGQYMITATLSNSTVEEGFFPKEVALFAKIDGGEEVMYSYTNGGNQVGYVPDKNTPIDSEIYKIRTKIGNARNITFIVSDDTYITKGELNKHNADANAHGGLLQNLKTQLSTHNTDISSHPAITDMIARILGASNWQENPVATLKDIKNLLGMGGIVAQRLEENGFVKFANGFTIQWGVFRKVSEREQGGNWRENQKTRKFSIQFPTDKIILIVSDGGIYDRETVKATSASGAQSVRGRVLDKASFKIAVDGSDNNESCDVFFVALGV